MKATRQDAHKWIEQQDTGYARTVQEKAKFLIGKLIPAELPHPAIWHHVGMIARGL
jgi:hypothetical protein